MSGDPVIDEALKIRDRLLNVAKEIGYQHKPGALRDFDMKTCKQAAEMLQKLGTEVDRLRMGIGHFHHGRMSIFDLEKMTKNWNGDK